MTRKRTAPDDPKGRPNFVVEKDGRARQRRRHPEAASNREFKGDGTQRLLDWRYELMARYVGLKGMSPQKAYRLVYDKPDMPENEVKVLAFRICQSREEVVLRIAHFTDLAVMRDIEHTAVTREWVEKEMVAAYKEATGDRDHKAAIKALELLGINVGMFVRRTDVTVRKTAMDLGSHEQIVEQFIMLARKAFPGLPTGDLRTLLSNHLGVPIDVKQIEAVIDQPIEVQSQEESLAEFEPLPEAPPPPPEEEVAHAPQEG